MVTLVGENIRELGQAFRRPLHLQGAKQPALWRPGDISKAACSIDGSVVRRKVDHNQLPLGNGVHKKCIQVR